MWLSSFPHDAMKQQFEKLQERIQNVKERNDSLIGRHHLLFEMKNGKSVHHCLRHLLGWKHPFQVKCTSTGALEWPLLSLMQM